MTKPSTKARRPRRLPRPNTLPHVVAYAVSLLERALRVVAAYVGGILLVLTYLLPRPLREGRFFRLVVARQIKVLTDDVGQAGLFAKEDALDAKKVARLGIGGAVDNLLILTLHASPVWALLAATDVCEGARAFTADIGRELQERGVIPENSSLLGVDEVLGGLAKLSSRMAETLDMPPISLAEMKETVSGLKAELGDVTDAASPTSHIEGLVREIQKMRASEGQSLLDVCAAIGAGTLRTTGNVLSGALQGATATLRVLGRRVWSDVILDWVQAAETVKARGFYGSLRRFLRPQMRGYRRIFDRRFLTFTEMGLSLGRWRRAPWRL